MRPATSEPRNVQPGRMWRSRWAAVGAAVAVTLGASAGVGLVTASGSAPSSFVSITPERILDTRDGVGIGLSGSFVSADGRDLQVTGSVATPSGSQVVVPAGATAVSLNVTVVQPSAAGFLSIRPAGTPGAPETSNLNFQAGDITPNAVNVALSAAGAVEITYDAFGQAGPTTNVLVDVLGYFVEGGDGAPGPAGPAGPQGPVGPAGPAGPGALWASVDTDDSAATLRQHVGVTGVTRVSGGTYQVDFEREVRTCARVATLNGYGLAFGGTVEGYATVSIAAQIGGEAPSNRVFVRTYNEEGVLTDGDPALLDGFDIIVICP